MNYDDIRKRYGLGSSDDESDAREENSTQTSTSPYDSIRKRYGITSPRIPNQGNTSDKKEEEDKTPTFDYETGKKGWEQYLADQSSAKQQEAEDESFWDKLGRWLGPTGATDTTLPMGNTAQIVHDVRNDTSYTKPSDDWSDEQRYEFGALYLESPEKAYAYAEKTNNANNRAKEEAEIKKVQDSATSNGWVGAAHTAGAIASAGLGLADYLNMLVLSNAGRDPLESDGVVSPFEYSTAVTEGIGTHLNETYGTLDEDIPIFGGKGWGDVYGLGTSIAQSFVSGHTLGPAGILVSYFGQGAASGMKDALNRGASEGQAAWYGAALGAFEGVAESIGIDNLFKLGSSSTIKGLLKNIVKQAGAEGLEEGFTSVLSNIADAWIMQDKSNFNVMLNAYMEAGMSEKNAKWAVFWDSLEGIAFDMIAGAASGGIHGGLQTGIQTGKYSSYVKNAFGGQVEDLLIEAGQAATDETGDAVDKYINKYGEKGKLSGMNIAHLLEITDTAKIKSAAEARLTQLGEKSNISQLADILAKQAQGMALTKAERTILENSQFGRSVSEELSPSRLASEEDMNRWAESIGTRTINPYEYNKGRNVLAEDFQNKIVTKGVPEEGIATEAELEASEEGDATLDDTISIMNNMVEKMELSDDVAGQMLEHFKPSDVQQAKLYQHAVPLAYNYGKIGYSAGLRYITSLSEQDKNYAYQRGAIDALIEADSKQSQIESSKTGSAQGTTKKKGIIYEGGYEYKEKTATPLQKSSMKAIEVINAISNLEIHVFESVEENGKRVYNLNGEKVNAPNGYFKDGNKIYIDINAGQHGEGLMLDTLGHEVTHYIRENDAKGFKAIADFLIEQYGKKGVNVEALLESQRKKIRNRYAREGEALPSDAKLNDMAYEELVADAMSEMLSDPKAYDKLAKLKQQNLSAWETLRDAIKNILDKIKSILDQYKSEKRKVAKDAATPEANAVRDFSADAYEKLQDLYIKAFVEADANYEAMGEKHLKNKDVLFNLRAVETHKSNLEKQYSNDASISLETLTERYNKIIGIWEKLGGELNSKFLNEWNNKVGKDRAFTVFKAQAGYKYNVELSSMCKKGVPLFEAIDTIVKEEVMKELDTKVIGKEEKEILYDLLKTNNFEIPCAICYVEQARQREGVIIDAFLNGKIEKNNAGKTTTFKLGWNEVLKAVEKEMKLNGVDYTFHAVDRSIATDKYVPADISMDEATQDAFYNALKKVANKEIARYNKAEGKNRKLVTSITPAAIKEVFKGTLPSNLKIFKVLFTEPSSRFTMESDLLYSSMTTHNLATAHNNLYSLFNSQGGVSGYKTKQGTVVYWGDILGKTWEPSKVRDEGGIRNQSNSDFQMYTLLDQVQMYVDFSAKGYYLQAYTKVLSELKLFGLSRGKINASLIPAVHVYHNADGSIDIETTRAYAGLDKNGNLLFDDIEGINHTEAFMLLEDAEYSKSIGGICIGYSDEHIRKLLDDKRVQQIIGFHDKTDDPDKRYKGAKYAKNYNGLNEAINNKDGKTVHLGFNPYVRKAEKMFTFDANTETYKGEIEYNGKTYVADDIPKLAADLYLEMCKKKDYTPAYTDFDYHENYYKLLADFSLYDSQGHYAPHRKVAFNMPDSVPYLDINGKKKYMPTKDYIKAELEKELKVRDSISEALADKSETGLIPQFVKRVNESKANQSETKLSDRDSSDPDIRYSLRGENKDGIEVYETSEKIKKLPIKERQKVFLDIMKNEYRGRTAKFIRNGHSYYASFDYKDVNKNIYGDKLSDKKGWKAKINVGAEGEIFELVENAKYDGSKHESGKNIDAHKGVGYWDYFIKMVQIDNTVFDLIANVRKKTDGEFVYSIQLNKNKEKEASPSLGSPNGVLNRMLNASEDSISHNSDFVNREFSEDQKNSDRDFPSNAEDIAKEYFGITTKWAETGWLLKDGTQLDFSGRHWERYPELEIKLGESYYSGKRNMEHFEIVEAFPELRDFASMEYRGDNLNGFLQRGNIRIVGDYAIDLLTMPTDEQFEKLRSYFRENTDKYIVIGIGTNSLNFREGTNASIKIEAIRDYFLKGKDRRSELMRFHDEYYSDRDTETISNRTLLANALDSVAKNDIEKNRLNQYKSKIALIESEQAKLTEIRAELRELYFTKGRRDTAKIKSLQESATQIENRINTYDRQLLKLESTEALKGVLDREKKMAYKKAEQRGKESLRRQKEKDAATVRELMARNYESRKKATESRNKTAMREKIRKVVNDLNKLLLNPTQDKHVPIGLQKVVAEALDVINMDTMNAEERVAYYNDLISKSNNPDEIAMLKKKRDFFEYRDMNFKDRITSLKSAYAEFKESDDSLIRNAHNDAIEDLIKNTADEVGNKSLKDMSLTQLEKVYDMYKAILATVRNTNKMFKEGRQETVTENSNAVKLEVREVGGHKDRVLKMTKFLKKFGWEMLKPVTAMKVIGSKTFERLFNNVRAAEDTWALDVNEAKQFYEDIAAKYGYNKWDLKKFYSLKDGAGADISMTLEQIMSLYAYSKREQADQHLEFGGFIFDDAIEVVEKNKILGIPLKYEVNDANPHRLRKEHILDIISVLTKEQKDFVDAMQTYLSDVMGAKGNEVSLAMYDIKLYKEKNYFPLKTSRYFREFDPEKSGTPKIKNSGFSKKTVPQAGNPIVLSNFMDVWAGHVNDMSMYHAFVLPLEDFMRVYNYSLTAGGYDSVQQYIKNAYGSQANQYIERLLDDLNGGARVDSSAGIANKLISLHKKASVVASASVVVQQPSAIARALAYIHPKYFAKATPEALNIAKHKTLWAEVKKYAPVAIIKEMGYFDTGVGRGTVEWIKGNQTFMDKMDDVLSKAPAIADELCWTHIWEAVKKENKAKSKSKVGSEIFLMECGKRFTEVITNTQVYDSVLSRSGYMRSKDTAVKMATAFMAEPTTTVNMMVDGIIQGMRGNKKFTASTVGAISASIILNSILVSLVYAARDDDEDETYLEKYIGSLTSELLEGFNPLTYLPYIKDGWSLLQGYDVERSDMAVLSDLVDTINRLFNENISGWDKVLDVTGSVSSLFGIPLKNIIRDAKGMYNLTNTILSGTPTTGAGIKDAIEDSFKSSIPLWDILHESDSKADRLYKAIMSGDQDHIDRVKATYKSEQAYETALKSALRENDSRIHEAAQARLDGNISEYTRIAREIIAEGHFSQDTVVAAINSEMSAIKKGESTQTESTDSKDEVTSIYRADDINVAFDNGDTSLALSIIDELVEMKMANGMDEKKAKSSLRSSMTSYWKPLYKQAYASGNTAEMQRIKQILYKSGLYGSATEVIKDVNSWLKN